jgi:hypothetical protein
MRSARLANKDETAERRAVQIRLVPGGLSRLF